MESDTFCEEAVKSERYYQINQPSNRRFNTNNTRGRFNRERRVINGNGQGVPKSHRNLLDFQVNISRGRICESINHWEDDCPDNTNGKLKTLAEITLFLSVLHEQETLTGLTGEASNTATLDPDVRLR